MSKYIRTKDDELYKYVRDFDEYIIVTIGGMQATSIKKDNILKEADSIEELCDNFLVEYTNGEHTMFHDFYHLKRHYELYSQPYHNVSGRYGCIWVVGKGLIYVAKMNNEGELEVMQND